ncbi:MAG TPA: hypothetical protein VK911_08735 [Vicinamibacterales bacterium]|nr:hypothetical protein [Vicinamibacterales bacterium]
MQTFALSVLLTVGLLQLGLFIRIVRTLRNRQQLEERLGHLTDALSLLTETTETGLRANALEIARMAAQPPSKRLVSKGTASTRLVRARGRGRTTEQIAADERMSEGEVHLRLRLHDDEVAGKAAVKGKERRKAARRGGVAETSRA